MHKHATLRKMLKEAVQKSNKGGYWTLIGKGKENGLVHLNTKSSNQSHCKEIVWSCQIRPAGPATWPNVAIKILPNE